MFNNDAHLSPKLSFLVLKSQESKVNFFAPFFFSYLSTRTLKNGRGRTRPYLELAWASSTVVDFWNASSGTRAVGFSASGLQGVLC